MPPVPARSFYLILVASVASAACLARGDPAATDSLTPIPRVTIVAPQGSPVLTPARPTPRSSPPASTPISSASPTAGATPVAAAGTPSPQCVNGWMRPAVGAPEYEEALAILGESIGVTDLWAVAEMRYFIGPDAPLIIGGLPVVERWYVRAALASEPGFRGRWLIEKWTEEIKRTSAVAGWDTAGYHSPDWLGFTGDGPPTTYLGLPGRWSGTPYDFVTGAGDSGNPGLPEEVTGCLAGT
jgi:hypothetical protein